MSDSNNVSMGWMRDLPSIKDYAIDQPQVKPMLAKLKAAGAPSAASATPHRAGSTPSRGSMGPHLSENGKKPL